jgi:hypothetical protein
MGFDAFSCYILKLDIFLLQSFNLRKDISHPALPKLLVFLAVILVTLFLLQIHFLLQMLNILHVDVHFIAFAIIEIDFLEVLKVKLNVGVNFGTDCKATWCGILLIRVSISIEWVIGLLGVLRSSVKLGIILLLRTGLVVGIGILIIISDSIRISRTAIGCELLGVVTVSRLAGIVLSHRVFI